MQIRKHRNKDKKGTDFLLFLSVVVHFVYIFSVVLGEKKVPQLFKCDVCIKYLSLIKEYNMLVKAFHRTRMKQTQTFGASFKKI